MLYIGYLIILDVRNRLCTNRLRDPPPPGPNT